MPSEKPDGLSREFADLRADAWERLPKRFELEDDLPPMGDVIQRISAFLMPAVADIAAGENISKRWTAVTGWQHVGEGG